MNKKLQAMLLYVKKFFKDLNLFDFLKILLNNFMDGFLNFLIRIKGIEANIKNYLIM